MTSMYIVIWSKAFCIGSLYRGGVQSYFDKIFSILGRTPHPSHVLFIHN